MRGDFWTTTTEHSVQALCCELIGRAREGYLSRGALVLSSIARRFACKARYLFINLFCCTRRSSTVVEEFVSWFWLISWLDGRICVRKLSILFKRPLVAFAFLSFPFESASEGAILVQCWRFLHHKLKEPLNPHPQRQSPTHPSPHNTTGCPSHHFSTPHSSRRSSSPSRVQRHRLSSSPLPLPLGL